MLMRFKKKKNHLIRCDLLLLFFRLFFPPLPVSFSRCLHFLVLYFQLQVGLTDH